MQPVLSNGFYLATNSRIGPWSVTTEPPTNEQINNANLIRSFFLNEGWTINAISGMLGCMQGESTINPAFIQSTNRYRLPNSANDLSDVPNSVMQNFYREYYGDTRRAYAIGLVQWDGYNPNPVPRQKLVAFAMPNNIVWYDGWTQCYKIREEWKYDVDNQKTIFFYPVTVSGTRYTFQNFVTSTDTPEHLASAFTWGYERNAGGVGYRADNARYWFELFTGPDAPVIIPPEDFPLPLPDDPLDPPFDPDHPVEPVPGIGYCPPWMVCIFSKLFYNNERRVLHKWKRE